MHRMSSSKDTSPFSADELFMRGQRMKLMHRPQEAILYFKEFQKKRPKVATAYFEIAKQYDRMHKSDSVLIYAKKAMELAPENKWILEFYAKTLASRGAFKKAADIFKALHATHAHSTNFLSQRIMMLIYAKDYQTALSLIKKVEPEVQDNRKLQIQKQWLYVKLNQLDSAKSEVKKLIYRNPENSAFYALLAKIYTKDNKLSAAIEVYKNLLVKQPENLYAKRALGVLYKKNGQHDAFRKSMEEVFRSPGLNFEDKRDFVRPFLKYVEVDSTERADGIWLSQLLTKVYSQKSESYLMLGNMYYQCKYSDSALLNYKKALKLDSTNDKIWNRMLRLMVEMQRKDSLSTYSLNALSRFPENAEIGLMRGISLYLSGAYKQAVTRLSKTLKLKVEKRQTKGLIYKYIASCFKEMHEDEKADKYLKMANDLLQTKNIAPSIPTKI